jgi:hypothetical protein
VWRSCSPCADSKAVRRHPHDPGGNLGCGSSKDGYHRGVSRLPGVILAALALLVPATTWAATSPNPAAALKVFKRAKHSYDNLPAAAKSITPKVVASRRVATAVDTKKHQYYVYITQMKDKTACVVLIQGRGYAQHCKPEGLLFETGRKTVSVTSGLIGGVAQNDVKKLVLVGGSKRKTIPLTTDNGFIYGCPAPTNCAKWVTKVLGYNASGKLVSTEFV